MIITKETSPYLRRKADVKRMMLDVLIALAPTLIFSFVVFPIQTLVDLAISSSIMLIAEFIFVGLKNMIPKDGEKHTFKEKFEHSYKGKYGINNIIPPLISAVIFTLAMPAGAPIYSIILGSLFGIVFGKLVFGGLGNNIFNPAAAGRIFAGICFGTYLNDAYALSDVYAGATPLGFTKTSSGLALNAIGNYSLLDLFLGNVPGSMGEVSALCILIGGIYLFYRKSADIRATLS
ncbi:MAG: RnfABCDGE type electron transport complex subunit D [Acholeplasmatales bacterium]|nr:RnfABCDGE type electron transport complex subunit D [Acholeplasmatales bacterium]